MSSATKSRRDDSYLLTKIRLVAGDKLVSVCLHNLSLATLVGRLVASDTLVSGMK